MHPRSSNCLHNFVSIIHPCSKIQPENQTLPVSVSFHRRKHTQIPRKLSGKHRRKPHEMKWMIIYQAKRDGKQLILGLFGDGERKSRVAVWWQEGKKKGKHRNGIIIDRLTHFIKRKNEPNEKNTAEKKLWMRFGMGGERERERKRFRLKGIKTVSCHSTLRPSIINIELNNCCKSHGSVCKDGLVRSHNFIFQHLTNCWSINKFISDLLPRFVRFFSRLVLVVFIKTQGFNVMWNC